MITVVCGWCRESFETNKTKGEYGYGKLRCPHCGRIVNSSKKESTGKIVGRQHIHRDLRDNDIV